MSSYIKELHESKHIDIKWVNGRRYLFPIKQTFERNLLPKLKTLKEKAECSKWRTQYVPPVGTLGRLMFGMVQAHTHKNGYSMASDTAIQKAWEKKTGKTISTRTISRTRGRLVNYGVLKWIPFGQGGSKRISIALYNHEELTQREHANQVQFIGGGLVSEVLNQQASDEEKTVNFSFKPNCHKGGGKGGVKGFTTLISSSSSKNTRTKQISLDAFNEKIKEKFKGSQINPSIITNTIATGRAQGWSDAGIEKTMLHKWQECQRVSITQPHLGVGYFINLWQNDTRLLFEKTNEKIQVPAAIAEANIEIDNEPNKRLKQIRYYTAHNCEAKSDRFIISFLVEQLHFLHKEYGLNVEAELTALRTKWNKHGKMEIN